MKKILYFLFVPILAFIIIPSAMTGCTDNDGNGIDSVLWEGSKNPEDTSYRNPVWEPSLEAGTIVKGASMYVAVSATSQWTTGLTNICKTLTSNNLMTWSASNDAFSTSPTWGEGRVNSLSVDYARTVVGATYWMFYTLENSASIGVAFATTAAGPYTDRGELLKAETIGSKTIKDPFFIVSSTSFYICYTADDGTYVQAVKLSKNTGASLSGSAVKIASQEFSDVAIVRASSSMFYLMGTVTNGSSTEIHYGMASKITGPYLDHAGNDLMSGSNGELLIQSGIEIVNPENPMRGFLNTKGTYLYLAYNATESNKALMASGYARKPMFITPFEIGEDGWLVSPSKTKKGWTYPRFE
jgi:hypothetical protein